MSTYAIIVTLVLLAWLVLSSCQVLFKRQSPFQWFRDHDRFALLSEWRLYGGDGRRGVFLLETRNGPTDSWEVTESTSLTWNPWQWLWNPGLQDSGIFHRHSRVLNFIAEEQFPEERRLANASFQYFENQRKNHPGGWQWRLVRQVVDGDDEEHFIIYTSEGASS